MNDKVIFEKNEYVANNTMANISAVMAGICFIFWLLCMLGVNAFSFTPSTISFVLKTCPIDILFLITPIMIKRIRPELLKQARFKYFAVTLLILAIAAINLVLPKDGVMLWAAVIVVAALYFDPKVTIYAFILTSIMMLRGICPLFQSRRNYLTGSGFTTGSYLLAE